MLKIKDLIEKLINIVKKDSQEALGCTEPVAIAYATNVASKYIKKDKIELISVVLSENIYKNAKSVKIPNTGTSGINLAAAIGALVDETRDGFKIFSKINSEVLLKAKKLISEEKVVVKYSKDSPDIYIKINIETDKDIVEVITSHSHTHIGKIVLNGKNILEDNFKEDKDEFLITKLSFSELREIIENCDSSKLYFTLNGIETNLNAAKEGLEGYGSGLGKTLNEFKERGVLTDNLLTNARVMTAAAADFRMAGGNYPIMTSGGSGNQGIGIIIPISLVAKEENIDKDRLAKSLFFAHLINRFVKEYSGKLSGMCGCAIGSAIGATAGITWMLGGNDKQIAGACSNIYANLTGMICDGAKESCSMKLATSAEESIISAYLALGGVISEKNVGILGNTIEETISNIGKLSYESYKKVDSTILKIIDK